jgi:mannose-6-phosphate isomerase-like protein (cupin superfamily)
MAERQTRATTFDVRVPRFSKGGVRQFLAESDILRVSIRSGAAKTSSGRPRGEDELHAHPTEDHCFIVLKGSGRFSFPGEPDVVLSEYQGVFLPRGGYYAFVAEGDEDLIMLRVGALTEPLVDEEPERLGMDGQPLGRDFDPNFKDKPEPIPGAFFPR